MAETTEGSILIFRTPDNEWGEFTNQYPAPFHYMGNRFETVEQFLYYMRAVFGRSKATAEKILACGGDSSALSKTSKKQRILENNTWETVRPQIMRRGMRQKFLQNPDLRKKLLSTGFRLLVEVPKEGLLEKLLPGSEDWFLDPGKWKNRNQTGRVLMQVRADLRCADRIITANEAYVFPDELFLLQTPLGQMTLKEISTLPGAREAVRAYAETAQQYLPLAFATGDDFINQKKLPLVTMERAIARNTADIELALSRAKARSEAVAAEPEPAEQEAPAQADSAAQDTVSAEPSSDTAESFADTAPEGPSLEFGSPADPAAPAGFDDAADPAAAAAPVTPIESAAAEDPAEELPDDIPVEGFYELLYDLEEMMKLGLL